MKRRISSSSGTVQSLPISGLQSDTSYSFGIRAYDDVGNLSPVAETSASTSAGAWQISPVANNLDSSVWFDVGTINGLPVAGYSGGGARFAYRDINGNW